AAALAEFPAAAIPAPRRSAVQAATDEYLASLRARPDQWSSHYNLGNYYLACGDPAAAAVAFETAIELEPEVVLPYVNASIAYARMDRKEPAEKVLRQALRLDPGSPPVHLNLGMLLAEEERWKEAEAAFRATLKREPHLAAAAYNLSLLVARDRLPEAVGWARTAYQAEPLAKYGCSLALLLRRSGKKAEAVATLRDVLRREPGGLEARVLLGELLAEQGAAAEALAAYREALQLEDLPAAARADLTRRIRQLEAGRE
ncbi:MAG: tetratricopeptide repeat protein, partial [Thermoguttaceae bacterium]